MRLHGAATAFALMVLVAGATLVVSAPVGAQARSEATAFCGPNDKPENAYQGETTLQDALTLRSQDPYYCGLKIVGHTDIWNRGSNWQLARSQHCAYVSTVKNAWLLDPEDPVTTRDPAGVAVIDVNDPSEPEPVGLLREPGALDAVETMHAIDAGGRHVLVAGDYSGGGVVLSDTPGEAVLEIYDVSNCTKPKHITAYYWPTNVHDVTLSPDGRRVYGTARDRILVLDITNMEEPELIVDQPLILPDDSHSSNTPTISPFACHTVTLNRKETRMYCAGSVSSRAKNGAGPGPSIWDVSEISQGTKEPQILFVGEADVSGQGNHHAVPAMIDGKPYMIAANELGGCDDPARPRIWDVSNERNPRMVSEFRLEVIEHCDEERVQQSSSMGGSYASHYNNVDDPWGDTRLGLFGMLSAGVRIIDLRDPEHPREVAYYKPGGNPTTQLQPAGIHTLNALGANTNFVDACGARNLHIKETGHIWFVCQANGFYVAELSPEVKEYMGLR